MPVCSLHLSTEIDQLLFVSDLITTFWGHVLCCSYLLTLYKVQMKFPDNEMTSI